MKIERTPLTYNQGLDHTCINIVKLYWKPAVLAENARLRALAMIGAMRWRGATVAVDTPNITATAAIAARSHAGDETEGGELFSARIGRVLMCTTFDPIALIAEEMYVAQLHSLNTVNFSLVVVFAGWIYTLSRLVARNALVPDRRSVGRRYSRCRWSWSRSLCSPST
jgi:hypothetical protein